VAEVAKALADGVPQTSMPPYLALTTTDRIAFTAFVQSLYGNHLSGVIDLMRPKESQ
jgi:hypothetical protein